MKEIILMVGIPASGKSTFANLYFANSHSILSLDNLKTRYQEKQRINQAITLNENIVIDNTNVSISEREQYILLARKHNYKVKCYFFIPNVEESLIRNKNPDRTEVPQVAIFDKLKKLQRPQFVEGFDEIHQVEAINNKFNITIWERR